MRFILLLVLPFLLLSEFNSHCQVIAPMPPGFRGHVHDLVYDSLTNSLYACGNFLNLADGFPGTPMGGVSKWNGNFWDSLGSGADWWAYTMTMYNSDLIMSGDFNNVGGVPANRMAKWDGINWSIFGNPTCYPKCLYVNGNDLYVGGCFDTIAGIAAKGIARFDGVNWHSYPPINALTYDVYAITIYNNELYIGGNFAIAPGLRHILKFDGTAWVTVGGGMGGGFTHVSCFEIFQGNLYVAGSFQTSTGSPGNNIAIWDGQSWSQPANGVQDQISGLYQYDGKLYAMGNFSSASGIPVSKVAVWDGFIWDDFNGITFNNAVSDMIVANNFMYIGGGFSIVNNDTMLFVAQINLTVGISEKFDECYDFIQTNDNLVISSQGCENMDRYSVYDMTGRIIYEFNNSIEDKITVDISNLKPGIYFVRVENNQHNFSRKFVKLLW